MRPYSQKFSRMNVMKNSDSSSNTSRRLCWTWSKLCSRISTPSNQRHTSKRFLIMFKMVGSKSLCGLRSLKRCTKIKTRKSYRKISEALFKCVQMGRITRLRSLLEAHLRLRIARALVRWQGKNWLGRWRPSIKLVRSYFTAISRKLSWITSWGNMSAFWSRSQFFSSKSMRIKTVLYLKTSLEIWSTRWVSSVATKKSSCSCTK